MLSTSSPAPRSKRATKPGCFATTFLMVVPPGGVVQVVGCVGSAPPCSRSAFLSYQKRRTPAPLWRRRWLPGVGQAVPEFEEISAEFQLVEHQPAQRRERRYLIRRQLPRHAVHHAHRSEGVAIVRDQWDAGIKPHVRIGTHQRAAREAAVFLGVTYQEHIGLAN